MCGIIGILSSEKNAREEVIDGLKKLEYRGYDSWGVASGGKSIFVEKNVGKISGVLSKNNSNANLAIGHTRWATHGGVSKINSHPHTDCSGKIAVVHNGIVENYQELKKALLKTGHIFVSETDTEVIAHIIEEELKTETSFKKVIFSVVRKMRGSYSFILIRAGFQEIWVVQNGCPLVLGIDKNKTLVASDILACPAPKVSFLPEKTVTCISTELETWDIETEKMKKIKFVENNLENVKVTPGNFKHFLIKEIHEQPEILKKISLIDEREIQTNAALIRHSFGTSFISCGTSYHASLVAEYLFARISNLHINVRSASEFSNFRYFLTSKTLLLPISQSGETADVLEAAKVAQKKHAKIMSLVNNPNSSLARMSDVVMVTPAGPEIAVLSTKAFTSQIAILYLLSSAVAGKLNAARRNLQNVSHLTEQILAKENISTIKKLATKIKDVKNLFVIGRGLNYPTALEAALKIKEVSYIHAEGFAGGDLKHGPIALVEKNVPCIVLVANDEHKEEIISNAMEVKSRGGIIIGVAPENNEIFDIFIKVPDFPELSPIINIIPVQLLAYYLAIERGCDPDMPRNLAKSVTVK